MALAPVGITFVSKGTTNLVRDLERIRQQLGLYGDTAQKVGDEARRSASGIRSMNNAITGVNSASSAGQRSVSSLSQSFGSLNSAISAPSKAIVGIGDSIVRFGSRVTNLGRNVAQAGAGLSLFVTAPIILGFRSATQAAVDFESEIIKLSTQAGASSAQIGKISNAILGVGQASIAIETGIKPVELASAALAIYSSGITDTVVATELLTQSAKASQIGLGDTAEIARAATGAMKSFGIGATEAVDTLLKIIDLGNLEADELAQTLGRFSGIASILGVEFADAGAFIATFTRSGISAAEAVTALRATMSAFAKPTAQTKDALAALGLPIEEVRRLIADPDVGLNAVLIELNRRVKETGGDVGVELAQIFGNVRALSGVAFITGIPEELEAITLAIRNNGGAIDESFAAVRQTAGFQLEQLAATFDVLKVTLGNVLLPILTATLQRLLPFIEAIRTFVAENPKLIQVASIFALVAAAIGPLVTAMGTFILIGGALIGSIGAIVSTLGALISPLGLVAAAVIGLATAIGGPLLLGFAEVSGFFNRSLSDIATNAFAWGRNIVVQFARGMIRGAVAVVEALTQIGRAIASWLKPGSPPRLLPDIDKWGTAAMNEFLNGFTLADFDTFDAVADITEKVIRAGVEEITEGAIQTITDFRQRIAAAVTQASAIDGNFEAIAASIGFANAKLTAYAATMLRLQFVTEQVAAAQKEIEQINERFDRTVAPLNEELEAIEARRAEVVRAQRVEELQSILSDESTPELARELALLELREFQLLDQISTEETLRDEALAAAEAKLAALEAEQQALEDQAALQLRVIEAQLQQNELLKEQKDAVEKLAKAVAGLGDSIGAIGEIGDISSIGFDGVVPEGEEFDFADLIGEGVAEAADEIIDEFDNLGKELLGLAQPLIDKFEELRDAWGDVVQGLIDAGDNLSSTKTRLDGLVETGRLMAAEWIEKSPQYRTALENIGEAFVGLGQQARESLSKITESIFKDLDDPDSAVQNIGTGISSALAAMAGGFLLQASTLAQIMLAPIRGAMAGLPDIVEGNLVVLRNAFSDDRNLKTAAEGLTQIASGIWTAVLETLRVGGEAFLNQFDVLIGEEWRERFLTWLTNSIIDFITWKNNLVETARQLWVLIQIGLLGFLLTSAESLRVWFAETWASFILWTQNVINSVNLWRDNVIATFNHWVLSTKIAFRQWQAETRLAFVQWTQEIIESVNTWRDTTVETFTTWKDGVIQTFTEWKDGALEQITAFFTTALEDAEGWISDIIAVLGDKDALWQAGRDLIGGFKDGILSLASELISAAAGLVSDVTSAVNDKLQNRSPSKVMRKAGNFAGEGLVLGLKDTIGDVLGVAVDLGSVIAPSIVQAQPVVSNSATINMGGVNINNGMDEVIFEAKVRRILTKALGETL